MRRPILAALLLIASASLGAQQASHTISPGMSRTQVTTALGTPLTVREADGWTYMFYKNECTKACGMNDIVVLRADSVVDAIFRSADRHYTGTSSSPEMIPARVAAHGKAAAEAPKRNLRLRPAPANDVHPSMPVNPPKLQPAPTTPQKSTTPPPSKPETKKP